MGSKNNTKWFYKGIPSEYNMVYIFDLLSGVYFSFFLIILIVYLPIINSYDISPSKRMVIFGSITIIWFVFYFIVSLFRVFKFSALFGVGRRNINLFVLPVLVFIPLICGIPLYIESEKQNNDTMHVSGAILILIAIVMFMLIIATLNANPVVKSVLLGSVIILALATPIYVYESKHSGEHILSLLLYGVGATIFLSSAYFGHNRYRIHKIIDMCIDNIKH